MTDVSGTVEVILEFVELAVTRRKRTLSAPDKDRIENLDQTLRDLIDGAKIAPHGREFRMIVLELDPRITVTCPPFAARERAQKRTFRMICMNCNRTYHRGRRDKVACRACCDRYTHGRYDRRFRLVTATPGE